MTAIALPAPAASARTADAVIWRRVRFGLLGAVVALAAGAVVFGQRPASLTELKAAIVAGQVGRVSVAGGLPPGAGGLPPGSHGVALARIFWRDGAITRVTEVVQQSDETASPTAQQPAVEHVVGDLAAQLQALDGSGTLRVVTDDRGLSTSSVAGWQTPAWLGVAAFLVWLVTLMLLFHGPQPWWATRWSWFWVLFSPLAVVAVPLFLLLSGPPPGVPAPTTVGRRLTGGWAFLLTGALVSLASAKVVIPWP